MDHIYLRHLLSLNKRHELMLEQPIYIKNAFIINFRLLKKSNDSTTNFQPEVTNGKRLYNYL